jgi:purine-binding chemotaxis protein CheW
MEQLTRQTQHLPVLPEEPIQCTRLIVTSTIGAQSYALPIEAVREVVRLPALLTLAGALPFICGMLNLRGNYIPVVDGRILMDEPYTYDLSNQIIILGHDEPQMGLLVDAVCDVFPIQNEQSRPIGHHVAAGYLTGVVTMEEGSVILFDVNALLALVPDDL